MPLTSACEPPSELGAGFTVECPCGWGATPASQETVHRDPRAGDSMIALAEMTGGVTHDFRNILAVINAGLSIAERHVGEPAQVRLCLAGMREGVKRGLKLTSRLLKFTRENGHSAQPRDLNELLRELQVFLRYGAGPNVRIVFELAPSLPRCIVDSVQFNAAVLNLVVNARDAMPGGGEIRIGTKAVPGRDRAARTSQTFVHLSVQDSGQGMSPAVLRKVFKPHFTTKGEAGTGLGVPQVCAFMNEVGGHMTVKSDLGVGTTFELAFPADTPVPPVGRIDWRQIDRWVNEGGAGEEAAPASSSEFLIAGANAAPTNRAPAQRERHHQSTCCSGSELDSFVPVPLT